MNKDAAKTALSRSLVDFCRNIMAAEIELKERILRKLMPRGLSNEQECEWVRQNQVQLRKFANDIDNREQLWFRGEHIGTFSCQFEAGKVIFNFTPVEDEDNGNKEGFRGSDEPTTVAPDDHE